MEVVIEELSSGIASIKVQIQKISLQEKEVLHKLNNYTEEHRNKLHQAKAAYANDDKIVAEGTFRESEMLKQQIFQYQRIVSEIQKTRQKLQGKENQFCYTKDQLLAKQTLGEANVDVSQIAADISEHLMFLNESKELEKFDELIEEASFKSQAIKEIQGNEPVFDSLLNKQEAYEHSLEKEIAQEKEAKLAVVQQNLKIRMDRVFGLPENSKQTHEKENQQALLNRLKEENPSSCIAEFFTDTKESQTQNNVAENEDRINDFFEKAKPASGTTTSGNKDLINQFFNSKQ